MLRAESLVRRYGARNVVDGVELEVRSGEVLAVLGPNGAGKSTLLRLLLLLERPDAGRIRLDGQPVEPGDRSARERLAAVFQKPFLFHGSAAYNVAFGLRARGVRGTELARRVTEGLEAVGLGGRADTPVSTLSGGEAQRIALARALVLEPDLLALDEPTANLDVSVRRRFRHDLERLARAHARAVLVVTHDAAEAFALADRIAVMEGGRIVQVSTPTELVLAPATPFIAEFTGAELLLDGVVTAVDAPLVRIDVGGGVAVWASGEGGVTQVGVRAHVAYRPEDVVLADTAVDTSAVNRFALEVVALAPAGALTRVRLRGSVELVALVTSRSVSALDLAPGRTIMAQIKATALKAYAV